MYVKFNALAAPLLSLALLLAAIPAAASSIVVNGNFSGGPYTGGGAGWTDNLNVYNYGIWNFVYLGDHGDPNIADALTGCTGPSCITGSGASLGALSQLLPTVAGDSYTLSFLYSPEGASPNELQALFAGAVVEDLSNLASNSFVTYTVSGLVATSSSTTLEFLGRGDGGGIALTEVSVTDDGPAIPEPPSLCLITSGLIGFAAFFRRTRFA
jgi:hypothetical protein